MEGYFLPPVMFSVGEAISLLLGLTFQRRLRTRPFTAELESAGQKLLAAVPENLREILTQAQRIVAFEKTPEDIFHPELPNPAPQAAEASERTECNILQAFLQAILDQRQVAFSYRSPYRSGISAVSASPCGLLWDRDYWYLVGVQKGQKPEQRLWRADRVLELQPGSGKHAPPADFDIASLLDRQWLGSAMDHWIQTFPVKIEVSPRQAERLKQDWYYRYAHFEDLSGDRVKMTFGGDQPEAVFELLRWLGPEAELIEPEEWRAAFRDELTRMLSVYTGSSSNE